MNIKKYNQKTPNRTWNWGSKKMKRFLINPTEYQAIKVFNLKRSLNPYIKEDRELLIKRQEHNTLAKFRLQVYKLSHGLCKVCGDTLYNGERIELHHLNPKKLGGEYTLKNIIPLHETCHKKVTHDKKYKL